MYKFSFKKLTTNNVLSDYCEVRVKCNFLVLLTYSIIVPCIIVLYFITPNKNESLVGVTWLSEIG